MSDRLGTSTDLYRWVTWRITEDNGDPGVGGGFERVGLDFCPVCNGNGAVPINEPGWEGAVKNCPNPDCIPDRAGDPTGFMAVPVEADDE